MQEGLLEKIRAVGHWRINYRPVGRRAEPLSLVRCRDVIQKSSVSIRGWDFPHVSHRNDDTGGFANVGNYIEDWTNWSGFLEFSRLYRSTQFLSYVALHEDTNRTDYGNPSVPILDALSTVYSVTEFVEFLFRLCSHGLYESGVFLSIELRNTRGRYLHSGRNRIPFFDRFSTEAEVISVERNLTRFDLSDDQRRLAAGIALEVFDHFGWSPAQEQILTDIDRFYRREWS
jgi:hypothetical protein